MADLVPPVNPVRPQDNPDASPVSGFDKWRRRRQSLAVPQPVELLAAREVATEIATLPPIKPEVVATYPRSTHTGEPRRPGILLIAVAMCWLSVPVTVTAFARWWWQVANIVDFHASARLLTWTHPDPVSAWAIVWVMVVGLITLLMVVAAGVAAFNSWAGHSWIRLGSLVCLAVTALSFLLSWWFSVAMIPLAIGAGLLWLPGVKTFMTAMRDFHSPQPIRFPTTGIVYGSQPLIGRREEFSTL
ncbi:MAG: hypothetical protein FWF43_03375 [Propionibacteriaceae bacterium]|nr:hypothetical protein [Propionibacteriaceae bacterium]